MILSDTNRNHRLLHVMAKDMTDNPYKFLYNFMGINFKKPLSLKVLDSKTIGKFWKFAEKHLSNSHENYIIIKKKIGMSIQVKVISINLIERTFDMSKSYNADLEEIRTDLKTGEKYILSIPKNSRIGNNFIEVNYGNTRRSPNYKKAISKFTNSLYLNEFIRVSNADEVIKTFINDNESSETVGEVNDEVIDNNTLVCSYLKNMYFKGMKHVTHYTNLASSNLFINKLVDTNDNLPLDKSGYNRYLYRRELYRRLNEYKSDKIFVEYDNYTEVKLFKEVEVKAKELFLDVVRKRSLSKLSHNRHKTINLVSNISTEYALLMQALQKHYTELRKYRIDNMSTVYNSLDDVMHAIVELTANFQTFIDKYKKFSKQYRSIY